LAHAGGNHRTQREHAPKPRDILVASRSARDRPNWQTRLSTVMAKTFLAAPTSSSA
jgi:hypothetical protein